MVLVLNRSAASKQAELQRYKVASIAKVNAACGEVRAKYITPIAGQEMIYLAKETEATAFLSASPEPTDLTDYPFIAAEVGSTGTTAYEVAQVFANLSAMWRLVGSQLEQVRVSTNEAIRLAATASEVDQLVEDCRSDLLQY